MATLYAYSPNGTQATLSYSVIGFTQSLQQNGWCKLPNGLIFQWGLRDNTNSGILNFNIIFNNLFMFLRCNESVVTTWLTGAGGGYSKLKTGSVYLLTDSGIPKQSWLTFGI